MYSISSSIITHNLHFLVVNSTWMHISAVGLYFLRGWEGSRRSTCEMFRMDLHTENKKPNTDINSDGLYVGFINYLANQPGNKHWFLIGFLIWQRTCQLHVGCKKVKTRLLGFSSPLIWEFVLWQIKKGILTWRQDNF